MLPGGLALLGGLALSGGIALLKPLRGLRPLGGVKPLGPELVEELGAGPLEWVKPLAAWEYHFARVPRLWFPLEHETVFSQPPG